MRRINLLLRPSVQPQESDVLSMKNINPGKNSYPEKINPPFILN
jgi:hypothetical protein